MEGELIIVSIITTIGMLLGMWILNQNWFKRQEVKYRYQLKRAKLSKKISVPVKEEPTTIGTLGQLLPLLKNLDGDQISALADRFLGEGDASGIEGDALGGLLQFAEKNPSLVKSFLDGLGTQQEGKQPPETY